MYADTVFKSFGGFSELKELWWSYDTKQLIMCIKHSVTEQTVTNRIQNNMRIGN